MFDRNHTKDVKNSDFWSILYIKPLRKFRKPKFKNGDRVRISKDGLHFGKSYKPQFTREVSEIVAISRKPPTYTIKDDQDEIIGAKLYEKNWSKSFKNGIVYKRVGF